MRTIRNPIIFLALLYVGFVLVVLTTRHSLPERIATHFAASGRPDGWMSRESHLRFMMTFGFGFPLLVPVVVYCCRFLPVGLVNIPHRDYWLAPDRKGESMNFLFAHSLWLGCATVLFVTGCHWMVADANRQSPPHLSMGNLLVVTGGFLAMLAVWIAMLLRRFMRLPKAANG